MASVLDLVKHYQHNIEKYPNDEHKLLKCIDKLFQLDVTVQHLQETGVGRTMNALRKEPGDVGQAARALVYKWKLMVAAEESDQETVHQNDMSTHNGNGNGKDLDDSVNQSRNRHEKYDKRNSTPKSNHREQMQSNGDYSGSKRKYQSSEEEEPDTKKSKHSSSSENEDYKRKHVQVKSEPSESDSQDSDNSQSESSDSESDSSEEETKVKIKTEPIDKAPSSRHSSSHSNHDHKRSSSNHESSSSRKSHDSSDHSKRNSSETRHTSEKSSSKDKSSSRDKSSKDKESSSDKKQRTETKSSELEKRHRDESKSSTKQSSSDKHRASSQTERSEKHKSQSEKSKPEKEKHSSSSHKSEKEKHKSSSEKEISNERHKSKESSSSKEKHNSSSKDKPKDRSSSTSKEKSSSHKSDKKHSSSSDKSKSSDSKNKKEKNEDRSNEKKSSHSSSSSSKSKSSSSKPKEDIPKKKVQVNNSEDSDDGIDCGSGASFADVMGMIAPTKSKKKLTPIKDAYSPNNSATNDMSPAALLAPTAKLAPLPSLEISALPEISPNYKPRPPPKFLPHFSDEDAMSCVISSKNQRTKVYSGNKVLGKIPSLYEMCVQILQEHIDALEYTGGVPYDILKPVVDKATPQQLFMLEHHNPYLMEDTDHLWQKHCEKHFRNKKRQEMETWREMFMRCQEEQEHRLRSLTANIRMTQEAKKAPIKQTKMAYVDSIVKPPRNIARKQALHGTAHTASASPAARVAALAAGPNVLKGGVRPVNSAPVSASSFNKPKKAPLMQKALQFMRGRKR